jgi:hypothetical protein
MGHTMQRLSILGFKYCHGLLHATPLPGLLELPRAPGGRILLVFPLRSGIRRRLVDSRRLGRCRSPAEVAQPRAVAGSAEIAVAGRDTEEDPLPPITLLRILAVENPECVSYAGPSWSTPSDFAPWLLEPTALRERILLRVSLGGVGMPRGLV